MVPSHDGDSSQQGWEAFQEGTSQDPGSRQAKDVNWAGEEWREGKYDTKG